MLEWIQSHGILLGWLGATSGVTFLGTLVIVPWLVVRIPADYFTHPKRQRLAKQSRRPAMRIVMILAKNVLGYLFVATGILMLVLPGQGVMTMLIGVMFLDFPGKYQLERRLVAYGPVLLTINWLRQRTKRTPLSLVIVRKEPLNKPSENVDESAR